MTGAFERLGCAFADADKAGWVEFQWPLYEPKLRVTIEINGHIPFIWLDMDGKGRDIGASELLKLMETFE